MKLLSILALLAYHTCIFSYVFCSADHQNETFQKLGGLKSIAFNVFAGGSSHANWVLSILDELSARGHSTLFLTKDGNVKFGNKFPSIETVSLGDDSKSVNAFKKLTENIRQATLATTTASMINFVESTFEEDYQNILKLFKSKNIDVAICDHFTVSCQEACNTLKIPFLITSSIGASPDATAPYVNTNAMFLRVPSILEMTFFERLYDMFVVPVQVFMKSYQLIKEQKQKRLSLGIKDPVYPPEVRWKHSVKMFNTAFGLEPARPLGPLVEFIGPIIPKTAASVLTEELSNFLTNHQRVAYVAFGQHALATKSELTMLLSGLLEAYEAGEIDGIIWATRSLVEIFPEKIVTQSNKVYKIHNLLQHNKLKDILFLDWAPQTAILQHTSTLIFVTHSGAGSLHEGIHSGKRMVFFPFFGDQYVNSRIAEKFGLGLTLDYKSTPEEAARIIQRVTRDEDGHFQANVSKFQVLVQLKSRSGVNKGADLVEEVVYMHQDTVLHHRNDVKHDLSFIKAYNWDIFAFVLAVTSLPVIALKLCIRRNSCKQKAKDE